MSEPILIFILVCWGLAGVLFKTITYCNFYLTYYRNSLLPLPSPSPCSFFFFFPFAVLGIKPRTSYMLGKCSTSELYIQRRDRFLAYDIYFLSTTIHTKKSRNNHSLTIHLPHIPLILSNLQK